MQPSQNRWMQVLLIVACLLSVGNAALYWSMSSRFGNIETAISQIANHPREANGSDGSGDGTGSKAVLRHAQAAGFGSIQAPDEQIQKLKQQKSAYDPVDAASKLDRLMAQEPALPALEQTQVRLLQQAMQSLPANAPRPAGLQTTCKGRRCLISAGFSDELQAGDWANQLLLVGGKNLPKSARIVAVPLEGGNGAVSLQLYLY